MKLRSPYLFILILFSLSNLQAQRAAYWQQSVNYKMDIKMDVKQHQFTGVQDLLYTNNSPDELNRVFYHLYFNAFEPGSMMDMRSQNIKDPDGRVGNRIAELKKKEMGWHRIDSLWQDGKLVKYEVAGTILEVDLDHPIAPGKASTFRMKFHSQVPIQIRRSGRESKEGIDYTMSQWYPKMCEYDVEGWHAEPYIGREFHGVWGDFEVNITIDSAYTLGGTGILQNPEEARHGYETPGSTLKKKPSEKEITWQFMAEDVHDFAWAADPDFVHDRLQVPNGPELHFIYKDDDEIRKNWKDLQPKTQELFEYVSTKYGKYPYAQFTVIQGGDGGMEYPMATIITGKRSPRSLFSVVVHEGIHSWYYGLLATDEAQHHWMDEGFTCYVQYEFLDHFYKTNMLNPWEVRYDRYYSLLKLGLEEPMGLHADHFQLNNSYYMAAYSKGSVFLHQLSSIVGQENLDEGLEIYFDTWKYKHPTPRDFKRVMERLSGLELDWYFDQWIRSTHTIDYEILDVGKKRKETFITLQNIGNMPMPLDVRVTFQDSSTANYHIPLRMMRGAKSQDRFVGEFEVMADWPWTNPTYTFKIPHKLKSISSIQIDPIERMADINKENNGWEND